MAFSAAAFWRAEVEGLAGARHLGERRVLGHQEAVRRVGVGAGEVDDLLALVGDAHAGHDGVVLLGVERRDDAVPILRHDLALDLHAGAQVVGEVDLEAFELAAGAGEVPRRVGAFGGDLHGLALRRRAADGKRRAEKSETDSLEEIHLVPLFVDPDLKPGSDLPAALSGRAVTQ